MKVYEIKECPYCGYPLIITFTEDMLTEDYGKYCPQCRAFISGEDVKRLLIIMPDIVDIIEEKEYKK